MPSLALRLTNRVTSNNPSEIYGNLNANGKVILVNPNGVIFGKGSSVNVGSLVATTMNVKDSDYLNDKEIYTRDNAIGSIVNEGTITAQEKGYIALLSPKVLNEGVIRAVKGTVSLSGADKIELTLDSSGLKTIIVEPSTIATLIENKSLVEADGGIIYIGVKQVEKLLDTAMNIKNSGTLQANSMNDLLGKVTLDGDNIEVSGTIQAKEGEIYVGNQNNNRTVVKSTANIEAKFVETSGKSLKVEDGVKIKAKEWLLDPTDIMISSSGGEAITGSAISGNTIETQLNAGTSVLLEATNNITVNDNINKTTGSTTTLTLKAGNDITIVSGKSIKSTSSTGALNLILWSNSDGNGGIVKIGDAVSGNTSTTIDTNGGGLWVGGSSGTGSGTGTWYGASDPFNMVDDGDGGTRPNPLSITVGDGFAKNIGTVISNNNPGIYAYKADIKAGVIVFNGSTTSSTSFAIATSGFPEKITSSGNFYAYTENQGMNFSQTLDVAGNATFHEYANTGVGGSAIQAMYSTNNFHNGRITVYAPKDIILYGSNNLNLYQVESTGTDRTINIQSFGGNINVLDYIKSASTWTGLGYQGAITLVADVNNNALDGTGGNITFDTGTTITAGLGGVVKLYTGSILGTTGISNLLSTGGGLTAINASGRFRYSSDVVVSTDGWATYSENKKYTTPLTAGINIIYRESPILNVTPSAYTNVYGETISPTAITLNSGAMQKGDTFSGTGTVTSTATSSSNAGTYDLTMSANAYNTLGYKLIGTTLTGGHIILKKDITYSISNDSKPYGQAVTLPTVSFTGGTPSSTPIVKVYDSSNNDVTAQATAGTLVAGIYIVKTELNDSNFALATTGNTSGTLTIAKKDITYSLPNVQGKFGTAITLPTVSFIGGTPSSTPIVKVYDSNNNDVTAQATAGTLVAGTYTVKVEIFDDNYLISPNGNLNGELIIEKVSNKNDYQSIIENIATKSQDKSVSSTNSIKNDLIIKSSVVEQKAKVIEEVNSQGILTLTSNANPFNTNEQIQVENGGVQNNSLEEKIVEKDSKTASVNVAELTISKTSNQIIAKVNPTEKSGFSFTVKEAVNVKIDAKEVKSITATSQNGTDIPSWLKFDKTTQTFSAINPPAGSLPISVKVNIIGANKTETIAVDIIK